MPLKQTLELATGGGGEEYTTKLQVSVWKGRTKMAETDIVTTKQTPRSQLKPSQARYFGNQVLMPVLNLFEAGGEYLKDTKEVRKEVTQDRADSYTRGYKKGLKKMKSSIMELEMERIGTMVCGFRISDNKMKSLITTLAYEGRSDAVQRDQGGQKVQTVVLPKDWYEKEEFLNDVEQLFVDNSMSKERLNLESEGRRLVELHGVTEADSHYATYLKQLYFDVCIETVFKNEN